MQKLILPLLAVLTLTFALRRPGQAAEFTCAGGDVACLIGAIHAANANGEANTITLAAGTYTLTAVENITEDGANGLPSILGVLTVKGAGPAATRLMRAATAPAFRLLRVAAGGTLQLEGLTLQGGSGYQGAGLANLGGTVQLTSCQLVGNRTENGWGGGLLNRQGTVVITMSLLADNAVNGSFGAGGGLFNEGGTVTITHSTFTRNSAAAGGGLRSERGTVTLLDSALVSNRGNTVRGTSGGLQLMSGVVTITNTTIAGNQALIGGGVWIGEAAVVLTNSTVAENVGTFGGAGGLVNGGSGSVRLHNTILAHNRTVGPQPPIDCAGPVVSLGSNLIGTLTGCTITLLPTDLTGDPGLGAFTDDGTPGQGYLPLLPDSPAIDVGDPAACPATDQLGQLRVTPCDIGAVEFAPVTVTLGLNQAAFRAGETLRVRLGIHNPGPTITADAYLGILLPDGVTVLFVTHLAPLDGVVTRLDADPGTFAPLATSYEFPSGEEAIVENFFVYTVTGGEAPGAYAIFTLLTPPGAFADGQIDPGDLLGLTQQSFTVSP